VLTGYPTELCCDFLIMPSIDAVGDDFLKSALTARADACAPIYRAEYGPHFNRPFRFSSRHYIIKNPVASARNR
jgi:hypothetical protein